MSGNILLNLIRESRIQKDNKSDDISIVCPKTKQFNSVFVCALKCKKKCPLYYQSIKLEDLVQFVEKHPKYKIVGEIMAKKDITPKETKKKVVQEKKFWIITGENEFKEVSEKEITENPMDYFKKQIWDKPPNQYEIVVSLKKIK